MRVPKFILRTSILAVGLLGCRAEPEKAATAHQPDGAPPTSVAQPHLDSATITRARESITNYLQANLVSSTAVMNAGNGPPEVPQMAPCVRNFKLKSPDYLVAVARVRVLDAQPAGVVHGSRPDSMFVLAELLLVARASEENTVWNVKSDVHVDSVRFTLVATDQGNGWMFCWPGFEDGDAPGQPMFFSYADSDQYQVRWKSPLTSWASLEKLAVSVRWSMIKPLENDSAVTRAIASGDFSNRVGVLEHTREGRGCLTIADSTLPPGTPLLVVAPDDAKSAAHGAIEARRAHECMRPGDEWGSVVMDHASYYDVVYPPGVAEPGGGIVIAARPAALHEANGVISIDIDGDGHPESFESCTSREGTHLIVNTRIGREKIERWNAYEYVPYDLEPTCKM